MFGGYIKVKNFVPRLPHWHSEGERRGLQTWPNENISDYLPWNRIRDWQSICTAVLSWFVDISSTNSVVDGERNFWL